MSLRSSIYKVQTSFLAFISVRCELLYFSTSCRTCQELFSSFSKFFFVPVALPSKRFITQPFYDITRTSFCQELFLNFLKFRIHLAPLASDLRILAHHLPFVKHFFTFFHIFFSALSNVKAVLPKQHRFIL